MPIFPLDGIRNAIPDRNLESILEAVRAELAGFPFSEDLHGGAIADVLQAFDESRPRLNVIAGMLSPSDGRSGADISIGLGFLPVLLRRCGFQVLTTERDPMVSGFAAAGGPVLAYTIGVTPPPIAPDSLHFLVFSEVLEHLNRSPVHVLRELVGLLKVGGRFILSTPNIARLQHIELLAAGENFLEPFDETVPWGRPSTDFVEHVREYSIREVVEAVEAAGMGVDTVVMTGWGERGYNPCPNPFVNEIIVVKATK